MVDNNDGVDTDINGTTSPQVCIRAYEDEDEDGCDAVRRRSHVTEMGGADGTGRGGRGRTKDRERQRYDTVTRIDDNKMIVDRYRHAALQ